MSRDPVRRGEELCISVCCEREEWGGLLYLARLCFIVPTVLSVLQPTPPPPVLDPLPPEYTDCTSSEIMETKCPPKTKV